jgi:hypothetical protein
VVGDRCWAVAGPPCPGWMAGSGRGQRGRFAGEGGGGQVEAGGEEDEWHVSERTMLGGSCASRGGRRVSWLHAPLSPVA